MNIISLSKIGGPDDWQRLGHLWRGPELLGRGGVGQAQWLHLKQQKLRVGG